MDGYVLYLATILCAPALGHFIKETLLPPLSKLVEGFPWDFSSMIIRETGSWQDISKVDR